MILFLTKLFSLFLQLVPKGFTISQLPSEITPLLTQQWRYLNCHWFENRRENRIFQTSLEEMKLVLRGIPWDWRHKPWSGAAMALFLMDHLSDQIMILGRWKSKAFLVYIWPQIIKWTKNFSSDMISFNNFFELCCISDKSLKSSNKRRDPEVQGWHYLMPSLVVA